MVQHKYQLWAGNCLTEWLCIGRLHKQYNLEWVPECKLRYSFGNPVIAESELDGFPVSPIISFRNGFGWVSLLRLNYGQEANGEDCDTIDHVDRKVFSCKSAVGTIKASIVPFTNWIWEGFARGHIPNREMREGKPNRRTNYFSCIISCMHMSVIENSFKVVHFVSEPLVYFSAGGCVKLLGCILI